MLRTTHNATRDLCRCPVLVPIALAHEVRLDDWLHMLQECRADRLEETLDQQCRVSGHVVAIHFQRHMPRERVPPSGRAYDASNGIYRALRRRT